MLFGLNALAAPAFLCHHYWVWYAGDNDLAFFHLDEHRTTKPRKPSWERALAAPSSPTLLASYKGVCPKDWQSCLAHIKRKAKGLTLVFGLLEMSFGSS